MNDKQQKFIILRADGMSYDKIAEQLKTAKATLIQWSKLYENEIKDIQFQTFIQIKETYCWNTKRRYETLLKQLEKIDNSILEADLSNTQIKDLFTIKNHLLSQLEAIENRISTDTKVTATDDFGYKERLRLKLNEIE